DVCSVVATEGLEVLHAIGLGLAGRVAHAAHERTGIGYCITPRWPDVVAGARAPAGPGRSVLRGARHAGVFDEDMRRHLEAAFPERAGESPLRLRLLRRGVDLDLFKPLPRPERRSAAQRLARRTELAPRLQGIEWERACIVLGIQHEGDHD